MTRDAPSEVARRALADRWPQAGTTFDPVSRADAGSPGVAGLAEIRSETMTSGHHDGTSQNPRGSQSDEGSVPQVLAPAGRVAAGHRLGSTPRRSARRRHPAPHRPVAPPRPIREARYATAYRILTETG